MRSIRRSGAQASSKKPGVVFCKKASTLVGKLGSSLAWWTIGAKRSARSCSHESETPSWSVSTSSFAQQVRASPVDRSPHSARAGKARAGTWRVAEAWQPRELSNRVRGVLARQPTTATEAIAYDTKREGDRNAYPW